MDYQRCADLHNEILYRGWIGSGQDWVQPQTWWEEQAPSDETASHLSPSLIEFLKRAYRQPKSGRLIYFFYYLQDLSSTDRMINDGFLDIAEENRYVLLYPSSIWSTHDTLGLAFDLHTSTATFIPDYNYSVDICDHRWGWLPLEDILGGYLEMVDERKVTAIPRQISSQRGYADPAEPPHVTPWKMNAYTTIDVRKAITAMKHLIDAIEAKIDRLAQPAREYVDLPWRNPAAFLEEFIPESSFAYEFLKGVSELRVRFRYIAPGIRFPTLDEFLNHPYCYGHQSLQILQIETTDSTPSDPPDPGAFQYIGVHISDVVPQSKFHFTNGFQLELPFRIGANGFAEQSSGELLGVNISDRHEVPKGSRGQLYQMGYPNGWTDYHDVRIHKVLENWAEMVESEAWEIDVNGVVGGIEKFMDADTEEHWEKYVLIHSW